MEIFKKLLDMAEKGLKWVNNLEIIVNGLSKYINGQKGIQMARHLDFVLLLTTLHN